MMKLALAAAAAFALAGAAPAFACCDQCPMHKDKVAAADKAEKKGTGDKVTCACHDGKDCKCGAKCECPNCHHGKEKKAEEKKS